MSLALRNSFENLQVIDQLEFPLEKWENIPEIVKISFLQMNKQMMQMSNFLQKLALPEKISELQLQIDSVQHSYNNFTTFTYVKDQEQIETHLKQIDQQLGSKIDNLYEETNNLQRAQKLIDINPNEESEQFVQNNKNFDLHYNNLSNTSDKSEKTQLDNAKVIWNMINTFIIESHIPTELQKIEEKLEAQRIEFEKKLSQNIQPKIIEQGEQIKALDTNLIHKEKKLQFQIEQINQNDFQGMKQQIRESKEYLQKNQQFQTAQTQVNNTVQQKQQEIILDYNTKIQLVQKDTFEFQRKIDQIKSITENMISLFQHNSEQNQEKIQKNIHECSMRIQKLENFYSQELGSINMQIEHNQKAQFVSLKEEVDLLNKKISKNTKDSYQEIQKLENAINDIFPRFKHYQLKNKELESQINSVISLTQQELKNNVKNIVKESLSGSEEKIIFLEGLIENLINLLYQNAQDRISGLGGASVLPMITKDIKNLNYDTNAMIQSTLNTSQVLLDDQSPKKIATEKSIQEKEELPNSILKSQQLENVKFLSELHTKPLILKSPIKFSSTLKKANENLSRTEIQLVLSDNQQKHPIHSKQKNQGTQPVRARNNSLGLAPSNSLSPIKLKLNQVKVQSTEESKNIDLSKTVYPRFNTTNFERKNFRSQSQEFMEFGKIKQPPSGVLNSDHIFCMELEAFKQQLTNSRKDNTEKRQKWSNSGSPN
ncbi:hypothetical protein TTHERM_00729180 (macronuclear) [Tetrahymena thermophila SB210]|uniref:Uncharacterized protein n=1 Tax=Tetrahymena thermophila (strain SB210) TaxID=312017 RepID=I7MH34_TETTS|nr:hypothetical protein TTHERM_00729180 [Tetrahymena thermophila SB210]EAS02458.2 hypothetical protein TTHERM_00729180 [Tetrahymena thermophila SB210]|eukprot:XP_001022703.2 hypothetical protein TTHERM_00729180 [Tetrahymena thermophila SB210]